MKRIITLLALMTIASAAHAQTDSLVVFDTKGDNLGISVAGFNITLGEDRSSSKSKPKRVTTNFVSVSFGANVFTYKPNYGNWEGRQNFMTDNTNGFRIGVEPFSVQVSLDRRNSVFIRAAMSTTTDVYRFKEPMTLINDENGLLLPETIEGKVKKSRISTAYFGVCAGFGFRISRLLLMFDFNTDLLSGAVSMYKNPKKTQYDINGFNNIRYRLGASATVEGFGIYADYSLTPLFREGVGNDGSVLSIGIRWGF